MWSIISTRSKPLCVCVCVEEHIRIEQHLLLHKSMGEKPSVFLSLSIPFFWWQQWISREMDSLEHWHFAQFSSFPPVLLLFSSSSKPNQRFRCIQDVFTKHKVFGRWFIYLHDLFSAKSNYKCSLHTYETMVRGCVAELTVRLMELPIIKGFLRSTGARHLFRLQRCCSVLHCHPLLHLRQEGSCKICHCVTILKIENFHFCFLVRE